MAGLGLASHFPTSESGFVIHKAFLLGAGLGTRLRPLTDRLPKPLVPLYHRPLLGWAMSSCAAAGVDEFAINTHHLPEAWLEPDNGLGVAEWRASELRGRNGEVAREGRWGTRRVTLFHEPELLETGGGIRNIADWIGEDDVLVHNGDIFTTLDLPQLLEAHRRSGMVATLALRSEGPGSHVAFEDGRVTDIRGMLGVAEGGFQFTGVYCFSPGLLTRIPDERKVSVIPAFLDLAREGALGGVVLDGGRWMDLGDIETYLRAHRELALAPPVDPLAQVADGAVIDASVVGPGAIVGAGAELCGSVVWPGARVAAGERLSGEVRMPGN